MTASLDMIRGRSNIVTLTNNSGGALVAGDVCVQDATGDEYATTTTSANSTSNVFIAAESIASAATGKFYASGYCPLVNVSASVTRGRFLFTHTVAKQAAENAIYAAGAFGKVLKSGTTPSAIIYSAAAQAPVLGYPTFTGARYTSNAAQNVVNNAAVAIIDFEDQVYDSGGGSPLVTTGAAWKFTAPATGYYHIDCTVQFASSTGWANAERGLLQLFKNNGLFASLDRKDNFAGGGGGLVMWLHGNVTIALNATDYIDIRIAQNSGGDIALSNDPLTVWINIERIG